MICFNCMAQNKKNRGACANHGANVYLMLIRVKIKKHIFAAMGNLRKWLWPVSVSWSAVLGLRHWLYNRRILKSEPGKLPTIVIGNLSFGGTGKTPHAEYIIKQLKGWCKPGYLSRGYGRKTRGFIWANRIQADASVIGDEAMQVLMKYPEVDVAVCENRQLGLQLMKHSTNCNMVVLDDAFQHRKLIGDLNILLTEFDRPYWEDRLFPVGRLRDLPSAARRADVIIVTKCPSNLNAEDRDKIIKAIGPRTHQRIFFTRLEYGLPLQIQGKPISISLKSSVLGLSGLADNSKFEQYLRTNFTVTHFESFADHHIFSPKEISRLWANYGSFAQAIVTTEKDATKLRGISGLGDIPIFVIPVSIVFLSGEAAFVQLLRST